MRKIKKLLYLINLGILVIIINSCQIPETNNSYSITADISGLPEGTAILGKLDLATNERIDVDTAIITNGKFTFSGNLAAPYLHTLFINDSLKIHFFLENSNIKIQGNINDLDKVMISGSREDRLFRSYPMDSIFARKSGMNIMMNYPDYAFAAFTAYYQFQIFNIQLDTMTTIIENFSKPVQQSAYFKHLKSLYETLKLVSISQPAPAFSMHDTQGQLVNLSDFKGKYVLIDFWASWCAPCRAVNPELVNLYHQFNQNGFTIIGVSVDKDRGKWLAAIKEDALPWVNLSEANGWNEITDLYAVKAVPQNFLLDPQGIIIAKNIEPNQLHDLLKKTL